MLKKIRRILFRQNMPTLHQKVKVTGQTAIILMPLSLLLIDFCRYAVRDSEYNILNSELLCQK